MRSAITWSRTMASGGMMNLSRHEQRQRQQRATELLTRTAPWLGPLGRRVLTALLVRATPSWQLFIRSAPLPADTADAFLVGPSGVCAVLIGERLPDEQ